VADETIADTLAFTVDDEENVLELILSNADGVSVRENSTWVPVNTDEAQPTIDDQEWLDAKPDAVPFWDGLSEAERDLTREQVLEYTVPSE